MEKKNFEFKHNTNDIDTNVYSTKIQKHIEYIRETFSKKEDIGEKNNNYFNSVDENPNTCLKYDLVYVNGTGTSNEDKSIDELLTFCEFINTFDINNFIISFVEECMYETGKKICNYQIYNDKIKPPMSEFRKTFKNIDFGNKQELYNVYINLLMGLGNNNKKNNDLKNTKYVINQMSMKNENMDLIKSKIIYMGLKMNTSKFYTQPIIDKIFDLSSIVYMLVTGLCFSEEFRENVNSIETKELGKYIVSITDRVYDYMFKSLQHEINNIMFANRNNNNKNDSGSIGSCSDDGVGGAVEKDAGKNDNNNCDDYDDDEKDKGENGESKNMKKEKSKGEKPEVLDFLSKFTNKGIIKPCKPKFLYNNYEVLDRNMDHIEFVRKNSKLTICTSSSIYTYLNKSGEFKMIIFFRNGIVIEDILTL